MKKLDLKLFLLLLTGMMLAACHNTPKASRFKNGTFRSKVAGGGIIKRTGKIQIETMKGMPQATFNVEWMDSTTYVLSPTEETAKMMKTSANSTVTVVITKTTDSSYFCKVTSNFSESEMRAEYVKIK